MLMLKNKGGEKMEEYRLFISKTIDKTSSYPYIFEIGISSGTLSKLTNDEKDRSIASIVGKWLNDCGAYGNVATGTKLRFASKEEAEKRLNQVKRGFKRFFAEVAKRRDSIDESWVSEEEIIWKKVKDEKIQKSKDGRGVTIIAPLFK